MNFGNLSLLAAEAAHAGGEGGVFDLIAARWTKGGTGMYPIALCLIIAAAVLMHAGRSWAPCRSGVARHGSSF